MKAEKRGSEKTTLDPRFSAFIWGFLLCSSLQGADPPVTALAFARDGKSVVVGSQAGLEVRAWPGLHRLRRLPTKLPNVHDLAFAPSGELLLAAGGAPAE